MNKGQFKKGNTPWNKGVKGIHLSPETQFDGSLIGSEHPSWKGGVQNMNNDCSYLWDGRNKRVRRPKKVWENHYGEPLPNGYVIYHANKDNKNDSVDNLLAIKRGDLLKINSGKIYIGDVNVYYGKNR